MIDDSMGNVLNKYLEDIIVRQDNQLFGLLAERDAAYATIGKKDEHIESLMEHIGHLTKTIEKFAEEKVQLLATVAAYKTNMKPLNDLIDLLEEEVNDAEHEVLGLKDQREINHRRIQEKDNIIVGLRDDIAGMQRFIDRLETTNIALGIQAAEAEHRADQEKRGRLQLVMRM
jgi:chromosome segregation ATPase